AEPDAGLEHEEPAPVAVHLDARVAPVDLPAEHVHGADLGLRVPPERDIRRDGHGELADPDAGVDVGLSGPEPDGAEVDLQVSDSEAVFPLDLGCRGRLRTGHAYHV